MFDEFVLVEIETFFRVVGSYGSRFVYLGILVSSWKCRRIFRERRNDLGSDERINGYLY